MVQNERRMAGWRGGEMRGIAVTLMVAAFLPLFTPTAAHPGHELPYYPSYYPQEIRLQSIAPEAAAALLQTSAIQAYVGGDPFVGAKPPAHLGSAESFKGFLVATFNPAAAAGQDRDRRCALSRHLLAALSTAKGSYHFHPYPVTPYHMDYLHHFDRVTALMRQISAASQADSSTMAAMAVRPSGSLAEALLPPASRSAGAGGEVTLEEVTVDELLAGDRTSLNGWLGPLWMKEGWFHAYRLLADRLADAAAKQRAAELYGRLTDGRYTGQAQRLNLERQLVALLTQGCERVVVGYTVKREFYSAEYSAGVENIAYDAQAGLNSHLFLRTVKLKDFPWNGWLKIGIDARPQAAWNPLGGFSDAVGRLLWAAIGDPALLPAPHNGLWMANRFSPNVTVAGAAPEGLQLPRDALLPDPASGRLVEVGEGRSAAVKVTYRGLPSSFHDGTSMTVADLLYPYSLAYHWGMRRSPDDAEYDPYIAEATAYMRRKLAGVKVRAVEHEPKAFGELKLVQEVPVVEVYLRDTSVDFPHVAAIAPPWSPLPWHLMALMEEAVRRGAAAFSSAAARRRGLPWLDLVRLPRLKEQLASLVADFEVRGYRPEALYGAVSEDEARRRWGALKSFYLQHGHFLVTNGPYWLAQWTEDAVVLQVFRDLSYPLGVGSYDKYAFPPRAEIVSLQRQGEILELTAAIEKVEKAQRTYHVVREPLNDQSLVGIYRVKPVVPYIVLSAQGEVLRTGYGHYAGDGVFTIEPDEEAAPERATILSTIYLNDNYIKPDIKWVPYPVEP
jgi:hypothetical protein